MYRDDNNIILLIIRFVGVYYNKQSDILRIGPFNLYEY